MGVIKGLAAISKKLEDMNQRGGEGVKYLKLSDGDKVRIRFLQELDEDSPHYNAEAGLGFLGLEHSNPANFKLRAVCSADEGSCWACEKHQQNYKAKWGPKAKLYINVLVTDKDGNEEVRVLSQGNGPKSVTGFLVEFATDAGSITNKVFTLKRTGAGQTDTSYVLIPGPEDKETYDVTQHELQDLDKAVKRVPYEEQEAFYLGENAGAEEESTGTGGDAAW